MNCTQSWDPNLRGRAARVFVSGMTEWERSQKSNGQLIAGVQSRIERSMDVAVSREADELQKGLGVLATIGSTAPFIGLFGTVWGIMNAFIEIAAQQNTNLAVVALVLPKPLWRLVWDCLLLFRRLYFIINFPQTRIGSSADMKALLMNLPRS